jgi:ZIP family zinc transporter
MNAIAVACATFAMTLSGGLVALRFRDRLHVILNFSAGAVVAVALFDLLPESIDLAGPAYGTASVSGLIGLGFMVYLLLDRLAAVRHRDAATAAAHISRARLGASSLVAHSFFDGVAIGLSFQVSQSTGVIVSIAILAHDFSDGVNTVGLVLRAARERSFALRWLALDAVAPVLGAASTFAFHPAAAQLGLALAVFCGLFLYIGASDLLPESYHAHPTRLATIATLAGAALLYLAVRLGRG